MGKTVVVNSLIDDKRTSELRLGVCLNNSIYTKRVRLRIKLVLQTVVKGIPSIAISRRRGPVSFTPFSNMNVRVHERWQLLLGRAKTTKVGD
jgi:hypothetical protein